MSELSSKKTEYLAAVTNEIGMTVITNYQCSHLHFKGVHLVRTYRRPCPRCPSRYLSYRRFCTISPLLSKVSLFHHGIADWRVALSCTYLYTQLQTQGTTISSHIRLEMYARARTTQKGYRKLFPRPVTACNRRGLRYPQRKRDKYHQMSP